MDILQEQSIDLIILDLRMPGPVDGEPGSPQYADRLGTARRARLSAALRRELASRLLSSSSPSR